MGDDGRAGVRTISEATRGPRSREAVDSGETRMAASHDGGGARAAAPGGWLALLTDTARPLVEARSPQEAARACTLAAARLAPVVAAVWLPATGPASLALESVHGASRGQLGRLEARWRRLPRWLALSSAARARAEPEMAAAMALDDVSTREAGQALVMIGGARDVAAGVAASVAPLLETKLAQADIVATAQARNERLDMGLAWTAHELVAPLVAARAAIEDVRAHAGEDPHRTSEVLSDVGRELDELAQTCEGLLRWAAGASPTRRETTNLADVVDDAVASCRLGGAHARVAVEMPAWVGVSGDRMQLRVAIANLVRNALSYSPRGCDVLVTLEESEGVATVTVEDEGPGVPEGEREEIFDPFVRGRTARPIRGGRGLGLFIARRVVAAHEGTVWVESRSRGAAFKLQLPVVREVVGSFASC